MRKSAGEIIDRHLCSDSDKDPGNKERELQTADTSKGTIQGYNCQTVADERYQIVVASEAFGIGQDQSLLKPMVEEIKKQPGEDIFDNGTLLPQTPAIQAK